MTSFRFHILNLPLFSLHHQRHYAGWMWPALRRCDRPGVGDLQDLGHNNLELSCHVVISSHAPLECFSRYLKWSYKLPWHLKPLDNLWNWTLRDFLRTWAKLGFIYVIYHICEEVIKTKICKKHVCANIWTDMLLTFDPGWEGLVEFNIEQLTTWDLNFSNNIGILFWTLRMLGEAWRKDDAPSPFGRWCRRARGRTEEPRPKRAQGGTGGKMMELWGTWCSRQEDCHSYKIILNSHLATYQDSRKESLLKSIEILFGFPQEELQAFKRRLSQTAELQDKVKAEAFSWKLWGHQVPSFFCRFGATLALTSSYQGSQRKNPHWHCHEAESAFPTIVNGHFPVISSFRVLRCRKANSRKHQAVNEEAKTGDGNGRRPNFFPAKKLGKSKSYTHDPLRHNRLWRWAHITIPKSMLAVCKKKNRILFGKTFAASTLKTSTCYGGIGWNRSTTGQDDGDT